MNKKMRSYVSSSVSRRALDPRRGAGKRALQCVAAACFAAFLTGCPGSATTPAASRPPTAEKWFRRALADFQEADVEEARDSAASALAIVPTDPEVRLLSARIALARLEYAEALRFLKGMKSSDAAGLRGRALWYKGDLEGAADELSAMLSDPDVKDEWAKGIAKLARRGAGRTPFTLSGALLAPVEMPHVHPVVPFFVVPVEIDGDEALALISTGTAEVVLDSTTRQEPSWVSLRFDKRLEVHDVPALTQDLSGLSKDIGAPIKALLGVNLLRHLNVTLDYGGHQFVARTFTPPAPPNSTRLNVYYYRGGGMVLNSGLTPDKSVRAPLLVDTSMRFPVALDKGGWKKAGFDAMGLKLIPEDPEQTLRTGVVPVLHLGAYDVPQVPGVFGPSLVDIEKALTPLDLDGVIGAGLLAHFRLTFGDGGRVLWIEDNAIVKKMLESYSAPLDELEPPPGSGLGAPPGEPLMTPVNPPGGAPSKPAPSPPPPSKKTPDR